MVDDGQALPAGQALLPAGMRTGGPAKVLGGGAFLGAGLGGVGAGAARPRPVWCRRMRRDDGPPAHLRASQGAGGAARDDCHLP